MIIRLLIYAFAVAGNLGAIDLYAASDKFHPSVRLLWADKTERAAVWVFFRDKEIERPELELAVLENTYNYRAVERRRLRRSAPGLFDIRDLEVSPRYIHSILRTGAQRRVVSRWLNAISVDATAAEVKQIADLPWVTKIQPVIREKVEPETQINLLAISNTATTGGLTAIGLGYGLTEPQLTQINVIALHETGFTGTGMLVGVLDTGFRRTHQAFNHRDHPLQVAAEWDFVNDDANTAPEAGDLNNQHHHGTYILGTLGGYLPGTYVGTCFDAEFILAKVEDLSDEYAGEEDFFVAGLEFIEANGGDVATSSVVIFNHYTQDELDGMTSVMSIGLNVAALNGLHTCQGAGNEGHDSNPTTQRLVPPADAFHVVTCGSVSSGGGISSFSSDGPSADGRIKPEVLARGSSTWTVSPTNDSNYSSPSGTSLSTPLVAGAVACVAQRNPQWTVNQMRDALFHTTPEFMANGSYDATFVRGYGIIDALGASNFAAQSVATITSVELVTGTELSGLPADFAESDDRNFVTRSGFGDNFAEAHLLELTITSVTDVVTATELAIEIESSIDEPIGFATVLLRNWATDEFEPIGQYQIGSNQETVQLDGISVNDRVNENGEIQLLIKHVVFAPLLAFTFDSSFDKIAVIAE